MRLTHALLVIVDISGYTDFITNRTVSLLHAEQIITTLMESVIDRAEHPLTVNKLEGDAALLFRETSGDGGDCARDVLAQVGGFFAAFAACLVEVREDRKFCSCDACANTEKLKLKAFVHCGEIAIKQVRQFEELAGEDVIAIHRMLKNSVPSREYVLMSARVHALAPDVAATPHREVLDGLGDTELWLTSAEALPALPPRVVSAASVTTTAEPAYLVDRHFNHLPGAAPKGLRGLWTAILARLTGA